MYFDVVIHGVRLQRGVTCESRPFNECAWPCRWNDESACTGEEILVVPWHGQYPPSPPFFLWFRCERRTSTLDGSRDPRRPSNRSMHAPVAAARDAAARGQHWPGGQSRTRKLVARFARREFQLLRFLGAIRRRAAMRPTSSNYSLINSRRIWLWNVKIQRKRKGENFGKKCSKTLLFISSSFFYFYINAYLC